MHAVECSISPGGNIACENTVSSRFIAMELLVKAKDAPANVLFTPTFCKIACFVWWFASWQVIDCSGPKL